MRSSYKLHKMLKHMMCAINLPALYVRVLLPVQEETETCMYATPAQ